MQENLLTAPVRRTYFKYLAAAFGSSMITCIYGIVDTAVVGHAIGPVGSAALAVVMPIWTIFYSLGLLVGIGGSVAYSFYMGQGKKEKANAYFTLSLGFCALLALIVWGGIALFEEEMLRFFGADDVLFALAKSYMLPVLAVIPAFPFTQLLAAFLRNDHVPQLATLAVICGGVFNIFGDFFFVFYLDYGILGAGLATSMGAVISITVMLTHFVSKNNGLKLVRVYGILHKAKTVIHFGAASFISDVGMGVVVMLFNRSIMTYFGTDALAVYGVLAQMAVVVQAASYGIGQAAQPMLSVNYGASALDRVDEIKHWAFLTAAVFGLVWLGLFMAWPNAFVYFFMKPTAEVLAIAPSILRTYAVGFLFVAFNVVATYYFQSVMRPKEALYASLARGFVLCGVLIFVLPAIFGPSLIWWVMPITETLVCAYCVLQIKK